jgi:hypothetical protein
MGIQRLVQLAAEQNSPFGNGLGYSPDNALHANEETVLSFDDIRSDHLLEYAYCYAKIFHYDMA